MPLTEVDALSILRDEKVRFLRLVFSDIHGVIKNVEVPDGQFEKAIAGEIMFDGSSIQGFVRIQESDMLLKPDLNTLRIFPDQGNGEARVGLVVCDIANPDGSDFQGDPRGVLKKTVKQAESMGFRSAMGPEAEFFLFIRGQDGRPTTITHDHGSYFDLSPVDRGEEARHEIINILERMGFEVEAGHHEVAPGQHEIDFRYADALTTADNLLIFRLIVRKVAQRHGLHATFMPKPISGINGSGMHVHQSLFDLKGNNVFFDPHGKWGISRIGLSYIAGILEHAQGICAITNPTVNSYKRLVPGYEAPTAITWSERNRSPLVRVPARRGVGTRIEVRMPDPSCNPYLAFAVMLGAGLDGIKKGGDPGEPINKDLYHMSESEKKRLKIKTLPADLREALLALKKDKVILDVLGQHVVKQFLIAKTAEWNEYIAAVHQWEIDRYIGMY